MPFYGPQGPRDKKGSVINLSLTNRNLLLNETLLFVKQNIFCLMLNSKRFFFFFKMVLGLK